MLHKPDISRVSDTTISGSTGGTSIQLDFYGNRIDSTLDSNSSVVCLANGSWIETPDGARLVEELEVGDLVETLDRGAQPIRMICEKRLGPKDFARNSNLFPICLRKGAIAPNQPTADLWVSPQHRMLLTGSRVELLFGQEMLLIKAKAFAEFGDMAFTDRKRRSLTYYHILFDRHKIIFANDAPTESFYPGKQAVKSLDEEERRELFTLFPELQGGVPDYRSEDHATLRGWEAAVALAY
ncbi:MAG: hypothetical protein ACI861_002327 [Paracoccaceae bacterium]|jgi:hypothetical protein